LCSQGKCRRGSSLLTLRCVDINSSPGTQKCPPPPILEGSSENQSPNRSLFMVKFFWKIVPRFPVISKCHELCLFSVAEFPVGFGRSGARRVMWLELPLFSQMARPGEVAELRRATVTSQRHACLLELETVSRPKACVTSVACETLVLLLDVIVPEQPNLGLFCQTHGPPASRP